MALAQAPEWQASMETELESMSEHDVYATSWFPRRMGVRLLAQYGCLRSSLAVVSSLDYVRKVFLR